MQPAIANPNPADLYNSLMKEMGELTVAVKESRADKTLTPGELERIVSEFKDVVNALLAVLDSVIALYNQIGQFAGWDSKKQEEEIKRIIDQVLTSILDRIDPPGPNAIYKKFIARKLELFIIESLNSMEKRRNNMSSFGGLTP